MKTEGAARPWNSRPPPPFFGRLLVDISLFYPSVRISQNSPMVRLSNFVQEWYWHWETFPLIISLQNIPVLNMVLMWNPVGTVFKHSPRRSSYDVGYAFSMPFVSLLSAEAVLIEGTENSQENNDLASKLNGNNMSSNIKTAPIRHNHT